MKCGRESVPAKGITRVKVLKSKGLAQSRDRNKATVTGGGRQGDRSG